MNLSAYYWQGEESLLMDKCRTLFRTLRLENSQNYNINSENAYYTYIDDLVLMNMRNPQLADFVADRSFISTERLLEILRIEAEGRGIDTWWLDLKEGDTITITDLVLERNDFLKDYRGKELEISEIKYCGFNINSIYVSEKYFNGDFSYYHLKEVPGVEFLSSCFNPIGTVSTTKLDLEDVPFLKEFEL